MIKVQRGPMAGKQIPDIGEIEAEDDAENSLIEMLLFLPDSENDPREMIK
jgi:hypothetical protein